MIDHPWNGVMRPFEPLPQPWKSEWRKNFERWLAEDRAREAAKRRETRDHGQVQPAATEIRQQGRKPKVRTGSCSTGCGAALGNGNRIGLCVACYRKAIRAAAARTAPVLCVCGAAVSRTNASGRCIACYKASRKPLPRVDIRPECVRCRSRINADKGDGYCWRCRKQVNATRKGGKPRSLCAGGCGKIIENRVVSRHCQKCAVAKGLKKEWRRSAKVPDLRLPCAMGCGGAIRPDNKMGVCRKCRRRVNGNKIKRMLGEAA